MYNHLLNRESIVYFKLSKKVYHLKGVIEKVSEQVGTEKIVKRLWIDGIEILPDKAYELRPFYEHALDWGELGGISSHAAALAICLAIFKEERLAENTYECFYELYVKHFPSGNFEMEIDLTSFLRKFKSRLHPHLYSRFCYSALIDTREVLMFKDPYTKLITVNLAENYSAHNCSIPDVAVKRLNERKQRLMFRLFAKDKYMISGYDFDKVMQQVEEIMSEFYWKSLERLIRKQINPLSKFKPAPVAGENDFKKLL